MSEMERNKGSLIPTGVDTELFSDEDWDSYTDNGFVVIDGEIYEVEWAVKCETDECGFADVSVDNDGNIHFHTLHYNGGGSLEEVIESALSKLYE